MADLMYVTDADTGEIYPIPKSSASCAEDNIPGFVKDDFPAMCANYDDANAIICNLKMQLDIERDRNQQLEKERIKEQKIVTDASSFDLRKASETQNDITEKSTEEYHTLLSEEMASIASAATPLQAVKRTIKTALRFTSLVVLLACCLILLSNFPRALDEVTTRIEDVCTVTVSETVNEHEETPLEPVQGVAAETVDANVSADVVETENTAHDSTGILPFVLVELGFLFIIISAIKNAPH